MVSCSVTLPAPSRNSRVAVAAGDRRGDDAGDAPAERRNKAERCRRRPRPAPTASRTMPFLTCAAPRLELRLDQRDQLRARREQLERGRQHQLERNEADVDVSKSGVSRSSPE